MQRQGVSMLTASLSTVLLSMASLILTLQIRLAREQQPDSEEKAVNRVV